MSALLLADAKTHLDITVSTFDAELQAIIDSAEATLAARVGPLVSTAVTRRIPGGGALVLPVTPVVSLTTVTPYQGTALNVATLFVDQITGLVTANNLTGFPALYYDVVYQAGRATCPSDLLFADKELVRHLWQTHRPSGRRTVDETAQRLPSSAAVPGAAYLLPHRVEQLIAPHVQVGAG